MRLIILALSSWFLIGIAYAQPLTSDEKASLEKLETDYAADPKTASLEFAWLLYRTDEQGNHARGDTVLQQVFSLQDDDPESLTYGQWGWTWRGEEKVADLNNALFRADIMFCKLWEQQNKMAPATQVAFIHSCKRLTEAAKRRWDTEIFDIGRDFVAYSNIFALYVEALTLAGDRFDDPRLKKVAKSQWTRWYNHISFFGVDEFASPTYNRVIFKHLLNIHDYCRDERIRRETLEVMDHIYLLQSALTHPVLKVPVTGISRDYRNFLIQGDARSEVLVSRYGDYTPPQKAVAINENRKYPFEVVGKASITPFLFRSYQLQDAAMGSMTGGNYFWQQIHCMAAVGINENERAIAFVQGSYTPVNGFTDQRSTSTLCVYNRLPNYWHLTQWRRDLSEYKETFGEFGVGISTSWHEKEKAPDSIVLEAYGYDLFIFPFMIQDNEIRSCELVMKHRTTTSHRYHPRPRVYDEYVFPQEPDWFGAYITLAKSGSKVDNPGITYSNDDGIRTFATNMGHRVRLFVAEKGDTRQLFNEDPALIPLLRIIE